MYYSEVVVSGGSYAVQVKYGFVTVLQNTQPVCTAPVVCPIPVGPFDSALPPLDLPADSPNVCFIVIVFVFISLIFILFTIFF